MLSPILLHVFALCIALSNASVLSSIGRQGTQYCLAGQKGDRACGGYMCLDWTFGSQRMQDAQYAYGENTLFAVGSYGPSGSLGKCYEFHQVGTGWKFVFQAINEGTDIVDGSFDIQTGAGGVGFFNACTMTTTEGGGPLFSESLEAFGEICGGIQSESECSSAPEKLQELCQRAFAWGGRNQDVENIKRIKCPSQMYEITGLRLLSDDEDFDEEFRSNGHTTTTMDCCRPTASYSCDESGMSRMPTADPSYPYVLRCDANGARVPRVSGCS